MQGVCVQKLREAGLRPKARRRASETPVIDIYTAPYHVAGSMPMLLEGPHGGAESNPYTYEEIVDIYLTVFEGLLAVGTAEGFRPAIVATAR
jgi:hypothetical protein